MKEGRRKFKPSMKRVVLNPRAYLTPFAVCVIAHHLPLFIAFLAIGKPDGYKACARLDHLFHWLRTSFVLHVVTGGLMIVDIVMTLVQPVYRLRRPENWLILTIFLLYLFNLAWTLYGEASFRIDTSECVNDSETIQDRADSIGYFQHYDFLFTAVATGFGCCTSYMCGVHTSSDLAEAEQRWQRRCTTMFRAFTCRKGVDSSASKNSRSSSADTGDINNDDAPHDEEDIFQSLGKILGKFFVVRYNTERFEGLQFNDLAFMLGLVSKSQKQERREERERLEEEAARGINTSARHLPMDREETTLRDLAFFGKMAIGIYGWPIYVWYSPFYWFRVFGCFSKKPTEGEQAFEHDNALQGNRASFVGYTGIQSESLVYLNCYNFVFQAPYSIVKDAARRELIISVRGSMSFYDFVTDGLAKVEAMHADELPDDVPNRHATRTHYGMLRTARSLFGDLQIGSRKQLFWDFAMRHCSNSNSSSFFNSSGTSNSFISTGEQEQQQPWKIVVCGHSMGAGVGAILTVMLKKHFPTVKAFLYAPPMMFDPHTAAWTKSFMTTAVYGDDIVPRLSIANVTRLRDEMATHFHEVAYEPLFRVRYGGLRKKKLAAPLSNDSVELNVVDVVDDASVAGTDTAVIDSEGEAASHQFDSSQRDLSQVAAAVVPASPVPSSASAADASHRPSIAGSQSARGTLERRASRILDLNFLRVSEIDEGQDVDVPGEIVHIQTVKDARKCSCTVVLGEQQLKYTLRDASYFRRMWVNPRAVQDHMVHHYDRQIAHLVNNCMDFGVATIDTAATAAAAAAVNAPQRKQSSSALSSDPSATSWIEASSATDDIASPTVTPYREIDEIV